MATHNFADDLKTLEHKLVLLSGVLVTTGASGAVDTTNTFFPGGTITRTTTGTYQIALDDQYKGVDANTVGVAGVTVPTYAQRGSTLTIGNTGAVTNIIAAHFNVAPQTQVTTGSAPIITFVTIGVVPSIVDANAACAIYITLVLKNGGVV